MSDLVKRLRRLEGGLSHTTMSGEIEVIDATIGEIERLEQLAFRHMAEDANRKQRIEELEKERDELKRKGEELCCLSGNLMVERDELKARLAKYEVEK